PIHLIPTLIIGFLMLNGLVVLSLMGLMVWLQDKKIVPIITFDHFSIDFSKMQIPTFGIDDDSFLSDHEREYHVSQEFTQQDIDEIMSANPSFDDEQTKQILTSYLTTDLTQLKTNLVLVNHNDSLVINFNENGDYVVERLQLKPVNNTWDLNKTITYIRGIEGKKYLSNTELEAEIAIKSLDTLKDVDTTPILEDEELYQCALDT
ncbi:16133_t:CDS:2, partial [Dentiscutata heterogama]